MKFGEERLGEYVCAYFAKYPEIAAIPVDIISLAFHTVLMAVSIIAVVLSTREIRAINAFLASRESRRNASCSKSQERHN